MELELPPPYEQVRAPTGVSAHDHAVAIAAEAGAGTLVWSDRTAVAEFAIVLEPAEDLTRARCVVFAVLAAVIDALATRAPPEKPITVDWPAAVRVDRGLVGGVRLAWPDGAEEGEPPLWLVASACVRLTFPESDEPGQWPDATSLAEEGFEATSGPDLAAATARHFMVYLDHWAESGLKRIAESYLGRLNKPDTKDRCGIDINGDLVFEAALGQIGQRIPLLPALTDADWLDRATGEPRR